MLLLHNFKSGNLTPVTQITSPSQIWHPNLCDIYIYMQGKISPLMIDIFSGEFILKHVE